MIITLAVMFSLGTIAIGAPETLADNKNIVINNNAPPKEIAGKSIQQSFYRNFRTTTNKDNYKMSGTLYQYENPRGLVRFETLPDVKLTVNGSIDIVEGELKLIYKDNDGTTVILAEGKMEDGPTMSIDCEVETSGKGEFYFETSSAICKFNLTFSKTESILYYLTNENPLGVKYE